MSSPATGTGSTVSGLFRLLRPKQWTKNLLLFAALLFSFEEIRTETILATLLGFILFSLVAGCVYILNDFVDRDRDRQHPVKKYRPMASGQVNPSHALLFGIILLILSVGTAFMMNPLFGVLCIVYFLLNVSYSFVLKHLVILDMMTIAAGFVLRAIAGGVLIHVPFTPWFLICTMLLSLFLAIGKRRNELTLLEGNTGSHRKVLDNYSITLLDQFNTIVTTATIISYSLFTFTSDRTIHLMWTIPLVIYGMFRYLYLIHMKNQGGSPDRVLFEDKPILITVMLYVISVVTIFAIFE
ncbi:decaprenyl-phosphate phosphoribosyltransferase [Paenibacillus polymyxa]|uniref:decaprenyl-phosphate phosphoribosyltransferase n=1 Tax=Paenibacillus TaxID=44249 RepID=UPI00105A67E1|nr:MULTISPECIES: decaprenyl-phosphate phosphoribosyltransferase [Paenibacillus]MCL6661259.1 decaprenyl-phosphate phosphoribosyltransferase [Paenibacillus amylolyticus]TDL70935.1 decaprenyl-phosphate phosphoribosyltransferase [Paenibacillus amylolyticus]UOK66251.1 decaprenyl-phosphate phosphoribosyltransferase [Paenibacillus sp. OVF10]WJM11413.1 decaprenyl-phosphate phosphoribosyltransferase [Paenibacillus sp. PK1-4R]